MTQRCPDRVIGHLTEPGYRAGNNLAGNRYAKTHGIRWVDNDWQPGGLNTHWPKPRYEGYVPKTDDRKWREFTAAEIAAMRTPDGYGVRTMEQAFRDALAFGQNVEVEAKFNCTTADCDLLALTARRVFGAEWQRRVWVKTLTDLPGGYDAALARLKNAKAAGFTTLLLVRNADRARRTFPTYVDYVRGATHAPIPPKENPVTLKYDSRSGAPSSTRLKYGHVGKPTGITVHHWGAFGQTHDGVVKYLTRDGATTSAHDVLSAGRCTRLVDYARAAWHSGSTRGNGKTIGVECRPEMSPEDWTALVEWCTDREEQFGHLALYRHSDWKATACPGKYGPRLAELRQAINSEHARRGDETTPTVIPADKPKVPLKQSKAVLRRGSSGTAVIALQKGLNRVFPTYSKLVVDGGFGARTQAVVREFQRRAGLVADGVVGPKTRAELNKHGVRF